MKRLFPLLFVLVIALNFCACFDDSSSSDPKSDPAASLYSITGKVTIGGTGLSHVSVELSSTSTKNSAITGADGSYTFSYLENGEYTVKPLPSGYTFDKATLSVTISSANAAGKDFATTKINGAAPFLHYTLPDQTHVLDNYPNATVDNEASLLFGAYKLTGSILYAAATATAPAEYVSGYALDQFVDKATVNAVTPDPDNKLGSNDARKLYTLVVVSNNDGFDNRGKLNSKFLYNSDLRWDQYILGYLLDLNYSAKVFFPASLSYGNIFNNKNAYDIYMFRKIDVKRPDAAGTIATFEVGATTESYFDHAAYTSGTGKEMTKFTVSTISFTNGSVTYTNVKAISLQQFITSYVTDSASTYTYKISALTATDSQTGWTWTALGQAYYLPDYDFICQVSGGSEISSTRISHPVGIEVESTASTYDYSAANPPAYAKYK